MIRITDEQWNLIKPHLPPLPRRKDGRGRPWRDDRECLDGILWILKTGAQWSALPKEYPPYVTCWRRLRLAARHSVQQVQLLTK
jgi:transposase